MGRKGDCDEFAAAGSFTAGLEARPAARVCTSFEVGDYPIVGQGSRLVDRSRRDAMDRSAS